MGYLKINAKYYICLVSNNKYWLYDDIMDTNHLSNKPIEGLKFFKNMNIPTIDAIFVMDRQNYFITGDTCYINKWDEPGKATAKQLKQIFPDIPKPVSVMSNWSDEYLLVNADFRWFLYDITKKKLINIEGNHHIKGDTGVELTDDVNDQRSLQNKIAKVQDWCLQLYDSGIYDQSKYNKCISQSRMMGYDVDTVEAKSKIKKVDDMEYQYGMTSETLIGRRQKSLDSNVAVYIMGVNGMYLTSNKRGDIDVKDSIKENSDDYKWFIKRVENDEIGIRNNYGKFLQFDKGDIKARNESIGPLSRWKMVPYNSTYGLENVASQKYLKSKPGLSMSFYTPNDDMLWNMMPVESDKLYNKYNNKWATDKKKYLINKMKHKFIDLQKAYELWFLEIDYQNKIQEIYQEFIKFVEKYEENTASKFYYPHKMDENKVKEDPFYRNYYNKINAWRFEVRPGNNRLSSYRPYIPESPGIDIRGMKAEIRKYQRLSKMAFIGDMYKNKLRQLEQDLEKLKEEDKKLKADYNQKTGYEKYEFEFKLRNDGQELYDKALKEVKQYISQIKQDIYNPQLKGSLLWTINYRNKVIRPELLNNYIKANEEYTKALKEFNQFEDKLTKEIETDKQKLDLLRKNIDFQLNRLDEVKDKYNAYKRKIGNFSDINLGNKEYLESRHTDANRTYFIYVALIVLGLVWCLIILVMIYYQL